MAQAPDSEQSEQGKVVKVGLAQLNNETPMFLKYIFRGILFASGLWALIASQFHLAPGVELEIDKWLLVGNTVMNYAIKFFGWAPVTPQ